VAHSFGSEGLPLGKLLRRLPAGIAQTINSVLDLGGGQFVDPRFTETRLQIATPDVDVPLEGLGRTTPGGMFEDPIVEVLRKRGARGSLSRELLLLDLCLLPRDLRR
jgi:hypothetical protein